MLEKILRTAEKLIPKPIFHFSQPYYHFILGFLGAIVYRFPSKELVVIGVTGTKGKSTTSEMIYTILKACGHKVALINTIEFRIGDESERNFFKMTTPGRFYLQRFLRKAKNAGCTHAVIEISSEAVLQSRHRFLYLDALVVTNISPEHIERHGSFEKYREAKLGIAKRVLNNEKENKILILNKDCSALEPFKNIGIKNIFYFSLEEARPFSTTESGSSFTWRNTRVQSPIIGEFNIENALAALTLAEALNMPLQESAVAIERFGGSLGRVQKIEVGQNFTVIVDYAHTPDSMEKLYKTFGGRKICVFGATGGGRDKWKRPEMGKVASKYCAEIILTNDDPYDENPEKITEEIMHGITTQKVQTIIDRRLAIRAALKSASKDSVVLITGKGTDPYLMEENNKRIPWSDANITKEELAQLIKQS